MAGVNLIKQIRKIQRGDKAVSNVGKLPDLRGQLDELVEKVKSNFTEFDASDALRLGLFILGVIILVGSRAFIADYHSKVETEMTQQRDQLDAQIIAEAQKLKALDEIIKESESLDKQIAELERKLNLIQTVILNRNAPVKMVDFVITEMPESVWLEKMELEPREGGKIDLSGFALSLQVVSDFITKLENAVYFPSWQLVEGSEDSSSRTGTPRTNTSSIGAGSESQINVENRPAGAKKFALTAKVSVR